MPKNVNQKENNFNDSEHKGHQEDSQVNSTTADENSAVQILSEHQESENKFRQLMANFCLQNNLEQFDDIVKTTVSSSELSNQEMKNLFNDSWNFIIRIRQRLQDQVQDTQNLKGSVDTLYKEMIAMYSKIKNLVGNKTLKPGGDYFKCNIEKLQSGIEIFNQKIQNYGSTFFTSEEKAKYNDEYRLLQLKFQEYLPNDENIDILRQSTEHMKFEQVEDDLRTMEKYQDKLFQLQEPILQKEAQINKLEVIRQAKQFEVDMLQNEAKQTQEKLSNFDQMLQSKREDKQALLDRMTKERDAALIRIEEMKNDTIIQRKTENLEQYLKQQRIVVENASKVKFESKSYHFIIAIDESGSMQNHFPKVKSAVNRLIDIAQQNTVNSTLTIILFNKEARTLFNAMPLSTTFELTCKGGSTQYECAFKEVEAKLEMTQMGQIPVLIFLTDGDASQKDLQNSCKLLEKCSDTIMDQTLDVSKSLHTFVVGFGSQVKKEQLNALCLAGNNKKTTRRIGGKNVNMLIYCDQNENELANHFQNISSCLSMELGQYQEKSRFLKEEEKSLCEEIAVMKKKLITDIERQRQELEESIKEKSDIEELSFESLQSKIRQEQEKENARLKQIKNQLLELECELVKINEEIKNIKTKLESDQRIYEDQAEVFQVHIKRIKDKQSQVMQDPQQEVPMSHYTPQDQIAQTTQCIENLNKSSQIDITNKMQLKLQYSLKGITSENIQKLKTSQQNIEKVDKIVQSLQAYKIQMSEMLIQVMHWLCQLESKLKEIANPELNQDYFLEMCLENKYKEASEQEIEDYNKEEYFTESFVKSLSDQTHQQVLIDFYNDNFHKKYFYPLSDPLQAEKLKQQFLMEYAAPEFCENSLSIREEIAELEKSKTKLTGEISVFTRKIKNLDKNSNGNKEEKAQAIKDLNEQIDECQKQIGEEDKEIKQLKESLKQYSNEEYVYKQVGQVYEKMIDHIQEQFNFYKQDQVKHELQRSFMSVVDGGVRELEIIRSHIKDIESIDYISLHNKTRKSSSQLQMLQIQGPQENY